jgi:predicted transcriptional regulator
MATQLAATEHKRTSDDTENESDLLELLGDEYTRRVLRAVTEQPRSGSEVVETADVSKATAYRRLDRLEAAGLIRSEMVFDPNGHHHEQFHAVVESIAVEFGSDGVSATVEAAAEKNTEPPAPGRH